MRAIDGADNYRVSLIVGPYHYATLFIGIIILICVSILLTAFLHTFIGVTFIVFPKSVLQPLFLSILASGRLEIRRSLTVSIRVSSVTSINTISGVVSFPTALFSIGVYFQSRISF